MALTRLYRDGKLAKEGFAISEISELIGDESAVVWFDLKQVTSWAAIIAVPTAVTGWFGQNVRFPGKEGIGGLIESTGRIRPGYAFPDGSVPRADQAASHGARLRSLRGNPGDAIRTTAHHRLRPGALRARLRTHDRASSGHAAMTLGWFVYGPATARPVAPGPIGRRGEAVAAALADAFLAAEAWRRPALVASGARVLGSRRRFLHPVVRAVIEGYRRPPVDRPRELAAFVAGTADFRAAILLARRRRRPVRIQERPVVPVRTARRPWRTPVVDDLGVLAELLGLSTVELDWFADRRSINRYATDRALAHYWPTWVGHRLIEAPKPRLRAMQRRLLAELFGRIPVHEAAHGFVPGRSVRTFAAPHAGRRTVVRLDLVSFFASVSAGRVYGLLRTAGYPEPVAHALTGLCTTATPARVLRRAPAGLPDRPYRLGLLAAPHLPQGAPTSPVLANLCAYRLDRRLAGLAAAFGARYTRYADDLAFSGDLDARRAAVLAARVAAVAGQEGFRAHPGKTRVRGRGDRQLLAGLVVNERPMVSRRDYDRLRAVLHNAARTGLAEQNRDGLLDFAWRLAGRVEWAGQGSAARREKLRTLLSSALAATPAEPLTARVR